MRCVFSDDLLLVCQIWLIILFSGCWISIEFDAKNIATIVLCEAAHVTSPLIVHCFSFFLSFSLFVFFLWSCFDWCHFCCRSHWHFSGYMCCFCQLLVGRSLLAKCRTFSTKMTHRSKNNSMKSICWKWHTHSKKHNERKKRRQKQHTFTLTLLHVTHHVIFIRSYRSQFLIYSFAAWFVLWCRNVNRELFVMLSCSRVFT